MKVNIKEELEKLDRNDFNKVCNLVDKIIKDIKEVTRDADMGNEIIFDMVIDYMIELINPELLKF